MKQRWWIISLGVAGLIAGGFSAAQAQETSETVVVPAPPSEASAVALQVENVLTIGETAATSAHEGGTADANALGLLGNTLVEGSTGGSQDGEGQQAGALLELEKGPGKAGDVDVEVTPFDLAVDGDSADSRAALLRVFLGDLANVAVLASESHTTYSPGTSTSKSFSDGVRACLLGSCGEEGDDNGLEIVVLHSEAESTGSGGSYVLRLGDTTVLDDDDLGEAEDVCSVTLGDESAQPLFLELLCVRAIGGEGETAGATGAAASVANTSVLGDTLVGDVVQASGTGGAAPQPLVPAPAVEAPPVVAGEVEQAAAIPPAAPAADRGALAFTGGSFASAILAALGLMVLGSMLIVQRRRALGRSAV